MTYKDIEKRREYRREYMRRYHAERKEMGLCRACSKPALPYSLFCVWHRPAYLKAKRNYNRNHAEERNKYKKDRYYRLKGEGRCPVCGVPVHEGVWCPSCIEARNYGAKRRKDFAITYI